MLFFKKNKKYRLLRLSRPKNKIFEHKKEIFGILFFAFFALLFLSLISYDSTDNSWFYFSSAKNNYSNLIGAMGANIAALFFYLCGGAAYFFALLILFLSYVLFFGKSFRQEGTRFFALCLFVVSATTFLRLFNLSFSSGLAGGFLGENFLRFFNFALGPAGTQIFLYTSFIVSGIVFFKISFIKLTQGFFKFSWLFLKLIAKKSVDFSAQAAKKIWCEFKLLINFKNSDKQEDYPLFCVEKVAESSEPTSFQGATEILPESEAITFSFKQGADVNQQGEDLVLVQKRFCAKKIFTQCSEKTFGKYKFYFLPNSCLNQNIFATDLVANLQALKNVQSEKVVQEKRLKAKIEYSLPDLKMFLETKNQQTWKKDLEQESVERGKKLEEKLRYFGIKGNVTAIRPGPVITLFEYTPDIDSKISKIVSLEDDLAMALTALSIRIVAPIPGKNVVGFEISNQNRQKVLMSDIMLHDEFENIASLPLILGVDITGHPVVEDLVKMPHLLVAGSTGSGKSVGLNCMLVSLLCKLRPDELKLILIDPKRLEFAPYADIPHLLFPIVTNPRIAVPVLKWLVQEMEDRYAKMASLGVRNIVEYHALAKENAELENIPFIVLMIDELADLMMVAGKDVESQIARIAQMARAAGIHMIAATQRPSVDVVTGLIKVNFPSRIAYRVSSKIDSRTIVDNKGAEKLLGMGDLLYMNSVSSDLRRIHGAYVSEKEIEKLSAHLKAEQQVEYLDLNEVLRRAEKSEFENLEDDLYPEIVEFLKTRDEISISQLQRQYKIGFNRSARIIEKLEMDGVIAPAQGSKPRKILRE